MTPRPLVFDLRYATTHYPGVGSYALGLAEALWAAHPDWPWRFLLPRGDSRFDFSRLPRERCSFGRDPAPGPAQWSLGRALHRMGAALYHAPYLLRPWGAPCPTIVTVHDIIPLQHPEGMGAVRRAIYRRLLQDALKSQLVVTDSNASRDAIRAAFPDARVALQVVHPGHRFEDRGSTWPAWPRSALLTVGINKPHKNLETLVKALAKIPREKRPLLVCAGPNDRRFPDAGALAARHRVAEDVRALGMVAEDRLAPLYRSATLFAFPTRHEGFGLPLLEALALGVPAVVSDLPVLREVAGDAALFCPPDDDAAWAAAIERLLGDAAERSALTARGRARARAFDYTRAATRIADHYRSLVPALRGQA